MSDAAAGPQEEPQQVASGASLLSFPSRSPSLSAHAQGDNRPPSPANPQFAALSPPTPPAPSSDPHAAAAAFWQPDLLPQLLSKWEEDAAALATAKETAAQQRQQIAQATRAFRDCSDPQGRNQLFPTLLRQYQSGLDAAGKRAAGAEAAFARAIRALRPAPDPHPLIALAVEHAANCSRTAADLAQLHETQRELKELKSHAAEIPNLRDQLAAAERRADAAEMEAQVVAEREDKARIQQARSARELADAQKRLEAIQASQMQERVAAAGARESLLRECDLLRAECDSARERIANCERERDELAVLFRREEDENDDDYEEEEAEVVQEAVREEEGFASDDGAGGGPVERVARRVQGRSPRARLSSSSSSMRSARQREAAAQLELTLVQKDIEISQLKDAIETQRLQLRQSSGARDALRKLQQELDAERARSGAVQEALDAAPKPEYVAELEEQLAIMQSVEFGEQPSQPAQPSPASAQQPQRASAGELSGARAGIDDTDDGAYSDSETASVTTAQTQRTSTSGSTAKTDVALMYREKCRRLETENASLRAHSADVEKARALVEAQLADAEGHRDHLRSLVAKLEHDLEHTQQRHRADNMSSGTAGENTPPSQRRASALTATPADATMLEIVSAQRDRFRVRISELESGSARLQRQADEATAESEQLRGDNLKLYERIRYLQSFASEHGNAGVPGETGLRSRGDDVESRYKGQYEEQMNPFAAFSRKERSERIEQLSSPERILLRGTQIFLQTKFSRYFLVLYALALHIVVFLTLYKTAHTQACDPAQMLLAAQLRGQQIQFAASQ